MLPLQVQMRVNIEAAPGPHGVTVVWGYSQSVPPLGPMSSPALTPFGMPKSAYAWALRPLSMTPAERLNHCGSAARSTVCGVPPAAAPGW